MRKQVLAAAVVGVFALVLAGRLAWATDTVSVKIPFSFIVQDKEMPAGHYLIVPQGDDETALLVRNEQSGGMVVAPVVERLADTGGKEPKVVFDKMADGKSYLSEVHVPGADGFLVGIAKGRETHVTLSGAKKK